MTYKYFFGSDKRSVPYLNFLSKEIKELVVVTTKPKKSGRGNKLRTNPVENFCQNNNIIFKYFDDSEIYSDMDYGVCVSFGAIFKADFINGNAPIFNIHLSRLPELRGPSPVESAILNGNTLFGIPLGFVFFYLAFKLIYDEYGVKSKDGKTLFWVLGTVWSLYGVAAVMPMTIKNISYNFLDIVSKNFYGLYLFYKIKQLSIE